MTKGKKMKAAFNSGLVIKTQAFPKPVTSAIFELNDLRFKIDPEQIVLDRKLPFVEMAKTLGLPVFSSTEYGDEYVLAADNSNLYIGTDYVRVVFKESNEELYWHEDEFFEDVTDVLGAVLGSLISG